MCVAIGAAAVQYTLVASKRAGAPAESVSAPMEAGTRLTLPANVTSDAKGALLLALSTTCGFCTQSMDFYRELSRRPEVRAGVVRVVVLTVEPEEKMKEYLSSHGLGLP